MSLTKKQSGTVRPCRLQPDMDDALCRLALKTDKSINALIRLAITRLLQQTQHIQGIHPLDTTHTKPVL